MNIIKRIYKLSCWLVLGFATSFIAIAHPNTGETSKLKYDSQSLIPSGAFWMGFSDDGDSVLSKTGLFYGDNRRRSVYVNEYYIDRYEVSLALWNDVYEWATNNGYAFDSWVAALGPEYPVCNVTWWDCVKWCNARSEKEGLAPCYYTDPIFNQLYRAGQVDISNEWVRWNATGYRLPTEAEWEKAARGGLEGKRFPWGDEISHDVANYFSGANYFGDKSFDFDKSASKGFNPKFINETKPFDDPNYTCPVDSFSTNGYGLYNMAGNVLEWCWDRKDHSVLWTNYPIEAARFRISNWRVVRGGAWNLSAIDAHCARQESEPPMSKKWISKVVIPGKYLGFRCVRKPDK